ncbi:helix-turn-helix domain-containing protein [Streptomyces acidiscabies]|uniref:Helix-turn-helix domain-containing protein n=1 Tax=Streptomyces acidiscabies TaxID=42234 RepID=A0AAP6BI34_9ACTN|nr:helix-turn-helix domain-containing protein [Streptomyces acidiscabies]MBP5939102.1 helix-turn-helix domain-containing protein [Streptomyces sp. LBUM 1476]MDX2965160.1 helix-turn-helix domain-containing protein [Streptomyces acidiscabies]MDX3023610.1 helix-turn-helix domain-containing protein [Streptomyces acidiscabies]MDX3789688.1 helix-turn-helix domain-containing protein [Streptomyces acidiscabies]GAQ57640.1 hypothetical protein a10_07511 [Streptomyces acidiscabies]
MGLRYYRRTAKLTRADAATVLGRENTRLSRVETGQYRTKSTEVGTLLPAYANVLPSPYAYALISSSPCASTQKTPGALAQVRQGRREILTCSDNPTELRTVID